MEREGLVGGIWGSGEVNFLGSGVKKGVEEKILVHGVGGLG
jgi:hypothetical protein